MNDPYGLPAPYGTGALEPPDEPAVCSVCGTWTQSLDPGYITPTCTDCAGRPYGGQA